MSRRNTATTYWLTVALSAATFLIVLCLFLSGSPR